MDSSCEIHQNLFPVDALARHSSHIDMHCDSVSASHCMNQNSIFKALIQYFHSVDQINKQHPAHSSIEIELKNEIGRDTVRFMLLAYSLVKMMISELYKRIICRRLRCYALNFQRVFTKGVQFMPRVKYKYLDSLLPVQCSIESAVIQIYRQIVIPKLFGIPIELSTQNNRN